MNSIISQWQAAWEERLAASVPHWKTGDPRFPFAYNAFDGHIAYDVANIPSQQLHVFRQIGLPIMDIQEADISITRERLAAGEVGQDFSREMSDPLLADPDDDGLILRANRFPKTPKDTLLITKSVEPQLMTSRYAMAQLRWADRGAVMEFHRSETFVNHFHVHMFPAQFAPIVSVAGSFMPHWKGYFLDEGYLAGYPLPHVALASKDIGVIRDAMMELNDKLEGEGQLFYQLALKHEDTYIVVFMLWKKEQAWPFGFSGIGIVQSPDFGMSESEVTTKLREIMVPSREIPCL